MTDRNKPYQKRRVRFLRPSERIGLLVSGGTPAAVRALYRLIPKPVTPPEFLPPELLGLDSSGAPAAFPAIDDETSVPPPNLFVAFVLQRMEHAVVSGGGAPTSFVFWQGTSPGTTEVLSGPYSYPLPPAGEVFLIPSDHGTAIYQSYTINGCSSATLSFPITLESWVIEGEDGLLGPTATGSEIGRVTLTDDDTITHAGLYNFHYVIRCEGSNGGVSDFTISGIVQVHCTDKTGFG
jgi:hypothetical protein